MKIHFIGGVTSPSATERLGELSALAVFRTLGKDLADARHEAIVSSPFEGSIDVEILRGIAEADEQPHVELHYPNTEEIRRTWRSLAVDLGLRAVREFPHAALALNVTMGDRYAWLLAQLEAMEAAHLVIAAGGKRDGSASMLLHFAEAQGRAILPLGYFGGAAADSLERQRYRLADQLGELMICLHERDSIGVVMKAAAQLSGRRVARSADGQAAHRFFISYSRDNPAEADLVEMTLRRRGFDVFRDERAFRPGTDLPTEISENIHRADVFIALWSREYACSPWCYDELELAVQRTGSGATELWILCLDDTRIVPPAARQLVTYPCKGRLELEARLIELVERSSAPGRPPSRPLPPGSSRDTA